MRGALSTWAAAGQRLDAEALRSGDALAGPYRPLDTANDFTLRGWGGMSRGRRVLLAVAMVALGCGRPAPSRCALEADAGLPDPLRRADGSCVASVEEWPARRAEVLELFRKHVYGRDPGPPEELRFEVRQEDANALGGAATLQRVALIARHQGRELTFELILFTPNPGARSGVFLLLNHRPPGNTDPTRTQVSPFWPVEEVIARGYGIAALQTADLAPDDRASFTTGAIRLFEGDVPGKRPNDAWKMLGAWSWGASRAMDYLVTNPRIDPRRVAVIGHSRGGKAALWAGAQDERFSLTVSNNSGCAGAALSRRPVGETVALINGVFPHWFAESFQRYNDAEDTLPIDQHELLGLLAPRGVAVGSASEDEWADPVGEYLGLAYASSVYALWELPPVEPSRRPADGSAAYVAPRGYHVRVGPHDLVTSDWQRYLDVADQLWR